MFYFILFLVLTIVLVYASVEKIDGSIKTLVLSLLLISIPITAITVLGILCHPHSISKVFGM